MTDTLLGEHVSKPYNPDIARVFYRAGYVERWGRGIQKICDACKELGADEPTYIVHGEDIMVCLNALGSALVDDATGLQVQGGPVNGPVDEPVAESREDRVLARLRESPRTTYDALSESFGVSRSTVKRAIGKLAVGGKIERIGGARYGHWRVL